MVMPRGSAHTVAIEVAVDWDDPERLAIEPITRPPWVRSTEPPARAPVVGPTRGRAPLEVGVTLTGVDGGKPEGGGVSSPPACSSTSLGMLRDLV